MKSNDNGDRIPDKKRLGPFTKIGKHIDALRTVHCLRLVLSSDIFGAGVARLKHIDSGKYGWKCCV